MSTQPLELAGKFDICESDLKLVAPRHWEQDKMFNKMQKFVLRNGQLSLGKGRGPSMDGELDFHLSGTTRDATHSVEWAGRAFRWRQEAHC